MANIPQSSIILAKYLKRLSKQNKQKYFICLSLMTNYTPYINKKNRVDE